MRAGDALKHEPPLRGTMDPRHLVRRAPHRPLVWLGERERGVTHALGERFPAYPAKEKDLVFSPPARRT